MHECQRSLIKLLLLELHALALFNNFALYDDTAEFMCLKLLIQISRSYSENCTLANLAVVDAFIPFRDLIAMCFLLP